MNENTRKEEIKNLEDKLTYLLEWMKGLKDANKIVSEVQQQIELVQWQLDVLKNAPDEAEDIPFNPPPSDVSYLFVKSVLPLIPKYDTDSIMNLGSGTVSGSSDYFSYVTRVGDLNTPIAFEYSEKFVEAYQSIQQTQERENHVKRMIANLGNPNTVERFNRASYAFSIFRSGVGGRTSAAMEIRTLLDGLQGVLFEKARKHQRENMTWAEMGVRLTGFEPGSETFLEFNKQNEVRSRLISSLSDIGKDREVGAATNLEYVWAQVLDHLYVTLSLLGFR